MSSVRRMHTRLLYVCNIILKDSLDTTLQLYDILKLMEWCDLLSELSLPMWAKVISILAFTLHKLFVYYLPTRGWAVIKFGMLIHL